VACTIGFSFASAAEPNAARPAALQPLADKAPSLPLTAAFEKVTGGESGPYVLHLKNDSSDAVKVSAKVLLSVVFHANSKARNLPEHVIDPGQVWSIPDLASADRVVVTAAGFAPLELTVP
jgi:hypothetical protein